MSNAKKMFYMGPKKRKRRPRRAPRSVPPPTINIPKRQIGTKEKIMVFGGRRAGGIVGSKTGRAAGKRFGNSEDEEFGARVGKMIGEEFGGYGAQKLARRK